jgi:DNA-binding transcriptional ArsR family regulator
MVQYSDRLDASFAALSDPTRRGILRRLGGADASISDLATTFEMTLTGMKKHVQILEGAGLVSTQKMGRVRHCTLGPQRLEKETAWLAEYRKMWEARLDRFGEELVRRQRARRSKTR